MQIRGFLLASGKRTAAAVYVGHALAACFGCNAVEPAFALQTRTKKQYLGAVVPGFKMTSAVMAAYQAQKLPRKQRQQLCFRV